MRVERSNEGNEMSDLAEQKPGAGTLNQDEPAREFEIEITPAMIEAGVNVIYRELAGAPILPASFCDERFAEMVFRAMEGARCRPSGS
jgi:hypothetical protein